MSGGMTGAGRAFLRRVLPAVAVVVAAGPGALVAAPQAALAASPGVSSVSVGLDRSCVVEAGRAWCWGSDARGSLGDGHTTSSKFAVPVDTSGALSGKTLTQVSTGDDSATCALDSAGAAYCWGVAREGDLGDAGGSDASGVPVSVYSGGALSGKTLTQVSVGNGQACALDSTGAAYCWGAGNDGKVGAGDSTGPNYFPRAVVTSGALAGKKLTQVSAGGDHTCALDSAGAAYCWGASALGSGPGEARAYAPVAVDTSGALAGKKLTQISAGFDDTCALDSAGAAWCWGSNSDGDLGDAGTANSSVPVAVDHSGALAGRVLTRISAGFSDSCAADSGGAVYCWGRTGSGALEYSDVPRMVRV
jgi:alpha-tubulin suppressor-like RCC1 family protein